MKCSKKLEILHYSFAIRRYTLKTKPNEVKHKSGARKAKINWIDNFVYTKGNATQLNRIHEDRKLVHADVCVRAQFDKSVSVEIFRKGKINAIPFFAVKNLIANYF